jgi:hypothetical protein
VNSGKSLNESSFDAKARTEQATSSSKVAPMPQSQIGITASLSRKLPLPRTSMRRHETLRPLNDAESAGAISAHVDGSATGCLRSLRSRLQAALSHCGKRGCLEAVAVEAVVAGDNIGSAMSSVADTGPEVLESLWSSVYIKQHNDVVKHLFYGGLALDGEGDKSIEIAQKLALLSHDHMVTVSHKACGISLVAPWLFRNLEHGTRMHAVSIYRQCSFHISLDASFAASAPAAAHPSEATCVLAQCLLMAALLLSLDDGTDSDVLESIVRESLSPLALPSDVGLKIVQNENVCHGIQVVR